MLDFLYIAGTVVFFALMLLYVQFCCGLGGTAEPEATRDDR